MNLARFLPEPLKLPTWTRPSAAPIESHFPRVGLQIKLIVIVIVVSLLGVLTSSFLVLTLQRRQLLETTEAALTRSSIAIAASLEHAMLRNDRAMTSQIVQRMVNREAVEHVRILNANGEVRVSSMEADVGDRIGRTEPICQPCHTSSSPSISRTTVVQSEDGHPVLLNVTLIQNSHQCESCHETSSAVLGIMMIETPLTYLDGQLTAAFWRIGLAAILTMGLLVGLMVVALRRLVIHPIGQLIEGMTEIRAGHLDYAVQASSRDELGDLAEAFDMMRRQLESFVRQARHLATLEERDRLAREMHDDLAQNLGYLKTQAWLADDLLSQNQVPQARSTLHDLRDVADAAYADVRETIFSLRAAAPSGSGLLPTLREYLTSYQKQYGIETQLLCEDATLPEFPADVQAQISRIIQEALANVHKHSGARQAWIRFQREDGRIRINMEDDGCGFDPASLKQTRGRHFGLEIMRERAESVGGELQIDSQTNSGTIITLRVPAPGAPRG